MQKVILTVCCILFLGAAYGQNSVVVSEQSVHGKIKESLNFNEIEVEQMTIPQTIVCP